MRITHVHARALTNTHAQIFEDFERVSQEMSVLIVRELRVTNHKRLIKSLADNVSAHNTHTHTHIQDQTYIYSHTHTHKQHVNVSVHIYLFLHFTFIHRTRCVSKSVRMYACVYIYMYILYT